jgi:hypothetical protein
MARHNAQRELDSPWRRRSSLAAWPSTSQPSPRISPARSDSGTGRKPSINPGPAHKATSRLGGRTRAGRKSLQSRPLAKDVKPILRERLWKATNIKQILPELEVLIRLVNITETQGFPVPTPSTTGNLEDEVDDDCYGPSYDPLTRGCHVESRFSKYQSGSALKN